MKSVVCRYCYKEIESRDELVTASHWFRVRPYHYCCFGQIEQNTRTVIGAWTPVNGLGGVLTCILMLFLVTLLFTTDTLGRTGDLVGILAAYPLLLRSYSILVIESKLPKFTGK